MPWQHLADRSDLIDRDVVARSWERHTIAIYRVDGRYYATSDICTHGLARLSAGEMVEGYIECPAHFGLFDIATGKAAGAPVCVDLRTYPVRIDEERIMVFVDDEAAEL